MLEDIILETKELIENIKRFLPNLINACESVSDLFYEELSEQSWNIFGQVVTGIDDLYKTLKVISEDLNHTSAEYSIQLIISQAIDEITVKFSMLNRYVDTDEHVSVGDVLKHELLPVFRILMNALGETNEIREQRFNANLDFLKNAYSSVYDQIKDLEREEENYQIVAAKDGTANMIFVNHENKRRFMYSQYDPNYEAARWSESIEKNLDGKRQTLMYGFGFGYHLVHFTQKYPNIKIYLLEPDERVLLAVMYVVDLEALFAVAPIEAFAVGVNSAEAEKMISELCFWGGHEVHVTDIPIYNQLYKKQKKELYLLIKFIAINYKVNKQTMSLFGFEHTKNILYNMAANLSTPSLANLRNKLTGMPAIIVGAGPSLEADIQYLKQIKDKAIIIVAGSAIQSLQHFGIIPHLIVSMDGGAPNYEAFKNINREHIPLVYIPQIEHRIVDNQFSNTFHAYLNSDDITRYLMGIETNDPIFYSTYSVTGTAIQAAIYMGCSEIVFTGQDLSYPTESMYAIGAAHISDEQTDRIVAVANEWVENVHGEKNRTDIKMKLTLKNIEKQLELHPHINFINATRNGAKIKNTKQENMCDVLERYKEHSEQGVDLEKTLQGSFDLYDIKRKKEIQSRLYALPEQMIVMTSRIDRIEKRLHKLLELSRTNPNKCLNSMGLIEDEWGEVVNSKPFISLYQNALRSVISDFDRRLPQLSEERNIQKKSTFFVQILGELVKKIQDSTPQLTEYVKEAIHRVEQLNIRKV